MIGISPPAVVRASAKWGKGVGFQTPEKRRAATPDAGLFHRCVPNERDFQTSVARAPLSMVPRSRLRTLCRISRHSERGDFVDAATAQEFSSNRPDCFDGADFGTGRRVLGGQRCCLRSPACGHDLFRRHAASTERIRPARPAPMKAVARYAMCCTAAFRSICRTPRSRRSIASPPRGLARQRRSCSVPGQVPTPRRAPLRPFPD